MLKAVTFEITGLVFTIPRFVKEFAFDVTGAVFTISVSFHYL